MTQDKLDKIKDDLEKRQTTLVSKMSDLKGKIEKMKRFSKNVLLVDTSGSMDTMLDREKRAIDVVNSVLDNFAGAQIYEFNTNCHKVKRCGQPRGGTNMAGAIYKVKQDGHNEVILVTDGQPDHEGLTLDAAKSTKVKLNIIYIGPQPVPDFLRKLAKISGGQFCDVELIENGMIQDKQLENKIKGFLSA